MYPYHNRIKQRIANGELVGYEFVTDYPRKLAIADVVVVNVAVVLHALIGQIRPLSSPRLDGSFGVLELADDIPRACADLKELTARGHSDLQHRLLDGPLAGRCGHRPLRVRDDVDPVSVVLRFRVILVGIDRHDDRMAS